ncbi:sugar transferase [Lactobacillus corticis]|uniref:Beta-1,6-galactofuranosyltransferase n=1 Tax=Lactobacillus corticis TaxID=2201249 RepID=A0A916QH68_9LACO|nr:sugar transferase [Lactobacillus corticis]GFZ26168.1 beta-1,6-galactofuranosyltransferase [Lactobacillus corticis]
MGKYIVTYISSVKNTAGPKAKEDVVYFLKNDKAVNEIRVNLNLDSKIDKLKHTLFVLPKLFKGKQIDELIIQYPINSQKIFSKLLSEYRKTNKDGKIIYVIHDVESLRTFRGDTEFYKKEIGYFNSADGIIAHNDSMKKWMEDNGVTTPIVSLGVFDYLNPQPINEKYQYEKSVCFAGNLFKADFLSKVNWEDLSLHVFGPNPKDNFGKAVKYEGVHTPEELPKYLDYNFGLIWDGTSIDTCNGVLGEYLKYNDPHKASLYLSSGIPVVVWDKAAIAKYIKDNNLGLTISSLSELPQAIDAISEKEYKEMKENTVELAKKLRKGEMIISALDKIESEI